MENWRENFSCRNPMCADDDAYFFSIPNATSWFVKFHFRCDWIDGYVELS